MRYYYILSCTGNMFETFEEKQNNLPRSSCNWQIFAWKKSAEAISIDTKGTMYNGVTDVSRLDRLDYIRKNKNVIVKGEEYGK